MDEKLYNYCLQGREPDGEPTHITCREDNIVSLSDTTPFHRKCVENPGFFVSPIP